MLRYNPNRRGSTLDLYIITVLYIYDPFLMHQHFWSCRLASIGWRQVWLYTDMYLIYGDNKCSPCITCLGVPNHLIIVISDV